MRKLVEERPDYLVTSQGGARLRQRREGADGRGDGRRGPVRVEEARRRGHAGRRARQQPRPRPGGDVRRQEPQAPVPVRVRRERHDQDPAYRMQRQAVSGAPKVKMIDLFDAVCPTDRCPVVFGNVLIYRGGSHIGAAYVKTTAPHLARALSDVGVPARFSPAG
ncbi:hypothetical protein V2I01_16530 [Micromonospora sp. BRA006-A]|nr:hypothetical protein [Micromonospora sp. BRA006-A]